MKQGRIFVVISCMFVMTALPSVGQSLSLEQLISVLNMDEGDAGIFLVNRGWRMEETAEKNNVRVVSWDYGRRFSATAGKEGGPGYESQAYFSIYNVMSSGKHYVTYSPSSATAFRAIQNRVIALKMKRIVYNNDGAKVIYTYEGSRYLVKFETETVSEFEFKTVKVFFK